MLVVIEARFDAFWSKLEAHFLSSVGLLSSHFDTSIITVKRHSFEP